MCMCMCVSIICICVISTCIGLVLCAWTLLAKLETIVHFLSASDGNAHPLTILHLNENWYIRIQIITSLFSTDCSNCTRVLTAQLVSCWVEVVVLTLAGITFTGSVRITYVAVRIAFCVIKPNDSETYTALQITNIIMVCPVRKSCTAVVTPSSGAVASFPEPRLQVSHWLHQVTKQIICSTDVNIWTVQDT